MDKQLAKGGVPEVEELTGRKSLERMRMYMKGA
jgi:hypothetical protein